MSYQFGQRNPFGARGTFPGRVSQGRVPRFGGGMGGMGMQGMGMFPSTGAVIEEDEVSIMPPMMGTQFPPELSGRLGAFREQYPNFGSRYAAFREQYPVGSFRGNVPISEEVFPPPLMGSTTTEPVMVNEQLSTLDDEAIQNAYNITVQPIANRYQRSQLRSERDFTFKTIDYSDPVTSFEAIPGTPINTTVYGPTTVSERQEFLLDTY